MEKKLIIINDFTKNLFLVKMKKKNVFRIYPFKSGDVVDKEIETYN